MEDGALNFPLFNLPNDPLKCVLQNMELFYQIEFSLLSKRSKTLVKSLNLEDYEVNVDIGRLVTIEIIRLKNLPFNTSTFHLEPLRMEEEQGRIYTPDFVRTSTVDSENWHFEEYEFEWRKPGFKVKDWIDHFLFILNRPKVYQLHFEQRTLFDVGSIYEAVSDVTGIHISDNYPVTHIKQIVQTFGSAIELTLFIGNLRVLKNFHSLLCQNFDNLILCSIFRDDVPEWKLDDLLIMNSRAIQVWYSNLTEKHVNRFLKLWRNGSNSKMEYMLFRFPTDRIANKGIILNGLAHQIVPSDHEKMLFKCPFEDWDGVVKVGYNIQRNDGTKATIILREDQEHRNFTMEVFVWN